MLLLYLTVSAVLFGSSAAYGYREECYGKDYTFPVRHISPSFKEQLYFTPSNGGSRRLLFENGEVKDPRIRMSIGSVHLDYLTERDEGTYSVSFDGGASLLNVVKLEIEDCAERSWIDYGREHLFNIPPEAEVLEFSPNRNTLPHVLWNRSDPKMNAEGRRRYYSWHITSVTHKDEGYYNIRKKDGSLITRKRLSVEKVILHYERQVDQSVFITYPLGNSPWTIQFTPEGAKQYIVLMASGIVHTEDTQSSSGGQFHGRLQELPNGIEISPLKAIDAGHFNFRDQHNNLAQTVYLDVQQDFPSTSVICCFVAGVILFVILCCCCVRKCCSKKKAAPQTTATSQEIRHDQCEPAGRTYSAEPPPSYSYQPLNPSLSRPPAPPAYEPPEWNGPAGRAFSAEPPPSYSNQPVNPSVSRPPAPPSSEPQPCNPVNNTVNPIQPQVEPLGGQSDPPAPTFSSGHLSSDTEPKFELKGLKNPSAPPLSSDSTFSDVYNSDKLNFL